MTAMPWRSTARRSTAVPRSPRDRADVAVQTLAVGRWLAGADPVDERSCAAPAGRCSTSAAAPAATSTRSSAAASRRSGIDASPAAVRIARDRGTHGRPGRRLRRRSRRSGVWGTALLLDGNIGIGGDPERAAAAASPSSSRRTGAVLVRDGRPGQRACARGPLRLEHGDGRLALVPVGAGRRRRARRRRAAEAGLTTSAPVGRRGPLVRGTPMGLMPSAASRRRARRDRAFWRSPVRSAWLTTIIGASLLVGVVIVAIDRASCRTRPTSPTWAATPSSRATRPAALRDRLADVARLALRADAGPARHVRLRDGAAAAGQAVVGHPAAVRVAAADERRPRRWRARATCCSSARRSSSCHRASRTPSSTTRGTSTSWSRTTTGRWIFIASLVLHVAVKFPTMRGRGATRREVLGHGGDELALARTRARRRSAAAACSGSSAPAGTLAADDRRAVDRRAAAASWRSSRRAAAGRGSVPGQQDRGASRGSRRRWSATAGG